MKDKIVRLGEHMPLSTRRVVMYCGETTAAVTPIGRVDGLADGVVLVRVPFAGVGEASWDLSPKQALDIADALRRAAYGVEAWQEYASGFNKVRVARSAEGEVTVTCRGRTRPMRLSKLRGHRQRDGTVRFYRSCDVCLEHPPALYVAADELREHGSRIGHPEVCGPCVERLANLSQEIAEVRPILSK